MPDRFINQPPETSRSFGSDFFDIPIIHVCYNLYQSFHDYALKFPKAERHTLASTIQSQILSMLESILAAAGTKQKDLKTHHLQNAATKIDLLRILIRLAKDCKCLSNQEYLSLETKLHEVGRMLGGWIKSL